MEQLGCAYLVLPLAVRRGWELAQSKPISLLGVFLKFVTADESLLQSRHLESYRLLHLVLSLIQFDQTWESSRTQRCYHGYDELSQFVVVHQFPPNVQYTPLAAMYSL